MNEELYKSVLNVLPDPPVCQLVAFIRVHTAVDFQEMVEGVSAEV